KISTILFSAVYVLWVFGIIIQFINSALDQDYSMFYEYGQIALSVFGFTLIGGIFENKKTQSRIVKKLFDSSLSFLITAISFFFLYSMSSVLIKPSTSMDLFQSTLIIGSISIAMLIGISGVVLGLLNLYLILVSYRISMEKFLN
ncbi:MAG: hypothetical protein KKF89_05335, partial [Nanoarchaeota archaeon]|nr:hypothetical protein [Nanoarchaeota archaeon]